MKRFRYLAMAGIASVSLLLASAGTAAAGSQAAQAGPKITIQAGTNYASWSAYPSGGVTEAAASWTVPKDLTTSASATQAASSTTVYAIAVSRSDPAKHYFANADTMNDDNIFSGVSSQDDSEVIAQINALTACHDAGVTVTDCLVGPVIRNGYIALAIDSTPPHANTWGAGSGSTLNAANADAMKTCQSYGGTTCKLVDSDGSNTPSSPTTNYDYWGYFYGSKYPDAILWAYKMYRTPGSCPGYPNCVNRCLQFVQLAYGQNGGGWAPDPSTETDSAADAFAYLQSQGDVHSGVPGNNHIGALVWFAYSKGGHVGIYLGNNQFISATDRGVDINDINSWSTSASSPYEGWSEPPSSWPGL